MSHSQSPLLERYVTEEQAKRLGDTLLNWRDKWKGLSQSKLAGTKNYDTYGNVERGNRDAVQALKAGTIQEWCSNGYRHTNGQWYFYEQMIYLLGLAGYIPPTPFPSNEEIGNRLKIVVKDMNAFPYPAAIAGTDMRFWGFNDVAEAILPRFLIYEILGETMSGFKILFRMHQEGILMNYEEVLESTARNYKFVNIYRQHEPHYLNFPQSMKSVLGETYTTFETIWNKMDWEFLRNSINMLGGLPQGEISQPFRVILDDANKTEAELNIRSYPIYGLGNHFVLATYVPRHEHDKHLDKIFQNFRKKNRGKHFLRWKGDYLA